MPALAEASSQRLGRAPSPHAAVTTPRQTPTGPSAVLARVTVDRLFGADKSGAAGERQREKDNGDELAHVGLRNVRFQQLEQLPRAAFDCVTLAKATPPATAMTGPLRSASAPPWTNIVLSDVALLTCRARGRADRRKGARKAARTANRKMSVRKWIKSRRSAAMRRIARCRLSVTFAAAQVPYRVRALEEIYFGETESMLFLSVEPPESPRPPNRDGKTLGFTCNPLKFPKMPA